VKNYRYTATPMGTGSTVERTVEHDLKLSEGEQKSYRKGVGMLLYLVKHSRPDLSNAVRELSKVMDRATEEHLSLMHRVVKFVLGTKTRGTLVKPNVDCGVMAYVDSDFAGDRGNRRSITGYLVHLFGVPVAWKSRQQGGVTLSSSVAEYYAIREVAKELKFVKMISDFLDVKYQEPMKVKVDNMGAIHLVNTASSGSRTKHVDTTIHFVRDLGHGEDKILDVEFVRSENSYLV
jgi:hypothetical protein